MTSTPTGLSGSTLDNQMQQDVQAYTGACYDYYNANNAYINDMNEFKQLSSGDPSAAILFFITICAPDFLSASEANINVYSTQLNISNDLRSFGTDATNKLNEGQNILGQNGNSYNDSDAFVNDINDLEIWTKYLDGTGQNSPFTNESGAKPYNVKIDKDGNATASYLAPIDATNGASIESDCESIKSAFGNDWTVKAPSTDPNNGSYVNDGNDIKSWFTVDPEKSSIIANYQESPKVKAIQESLQEINSSVSTLSSSQQTTFQYYLGNYNQCTSIFNSLATSTVDGEKTMITNQRSQ